MRGATCSLAFHVWPEITCLFLVCNLLLCLNWSYITFSQATTVDVERVFSQGRLLLPHVRNRLSVQSTRACMCVGAWSLLGLIKNSDIKAALGGEVTGAGDDLAAEWDAIDGLK